MGRGQHRGQVFRDSRRAQPSFNGGGVGAEPLEVAARPSQFAEPAWPGSIRLPLTELGEYMQFGLDARRKPGTAATAVCDQFSQQPLASHRFVPTHRESIGNAWIKTAQVSRMKPTRDLPQPQVRCADQHPVNFGERCAEFFPVGSGRLVRPGSARRAVGSGECE